MLAYTLPGFATSDETKSNAWALMRTLGVTAEEIDIRPAACQMLADLGHPFARGEPVYDVTFENVQAGLRTDYLFRLANHHKGLVVGTGDLSELGLGWCTFGVGDHMSHYNVNASVPKTLIQHLIRFVARSGDVSEETAKVLSAILATEISPELVPAEAENPFSPRRPSWGLTRFRISTCLPDRYGYRPSKIAFLALRAWGDEGGAHGRKTCRTATGAPIRWARSALAAGVPLALLLQPVQTLHLAQRTKITSGGSLSPRGDWRAPSDGDAGPWLAELAARVPEA